MGCLLGAALLDHRGARLGTGRVNLHQHAPQPLRQGDAVVGAARLGEGERVTGLRLQRSAAVEQVLLAPVLVGHLELGAAVVVEGRLIDGEVAIHPLVAQLILGLSGPAGELPLDEQVVAERIARHRVQHLAALHRLGKADAQGGLVLVHGSKHELVAARLGQIEPDVAGIATLAEGQRGADHHLVTGVAAAVVEGTPAGVRNLHLG